MVSRLAGKRFNIQIEGLPVLFMRIGRGFDDITSMILRDPRGFDLPNATLGGRVEITNISTGKCRPFRLRYDGIFYLRPIDSRADRLARKK